MRIERRSSERSIPTELRRGSIVPLASVLRQPTVADNTAVDWAASPIW